MKEAYPVIITEDKDGYYIYILDFDIATQGTSITDSIEMARDVIGTTGIDLEDDGRQLPKPYSTNVEGNDKDIITLVDVDFTEYRKRVDNRSVKKNVRFRTG